MTRNVFLIAGFQRILIGAILIGPCVFASQPKALEVSEGFSNPLGFYDAEPTFSWKLPEGVKKQTAY